MDIVILLATYLSKLSVQKRRQQDRIVLIYTQEVFHRFQNHNQYAPTHTSIIMTITDLKELYFDYKILQKINSGPDFTQLH